MIPNHLTMDEIQRLTLENDDLREQLHTAEKEIEKLLQWADLVIRITRNGKVSPAYRILYISLIDRYPEIFSGEETQIQVADLRENAGWISKSSAGNFLQDMQTIQALDYNAGNYNRAANERIGRLKINLEIFPYPESFDTKNVEARRKAREREDKKRKEIKHQLQILQCEDCGSANLVHDVTARCRDCGHIHETIKDIPTALLTIEPEVIELEELEEKEEEFIDQAQTRRSAPSVTMETFDFSIKLPPLPDMSCRKCGRPRRICWQQMEEGGWTLTCERR